LCEAAGFDTIFVETVGVGQSETVVHSMVDCFLLLMIAGAGDELQGIKRGIMEMADIVAINKADGENQERARRAANEYSQALHLYPTPDSGWQPEVLTCSALNSTDIDSVWNRVLAHHEHMQVRNLFAANRREQARHWLRQSLQEDLWQDFLQHPEIATRYPELEQRVLRGEMNSFAAARRLLEAYTGIRPTMR
ncbi:MAG: methylmalonyl Co-A mutase-associated GTPase MeaB, partial [Leptospiraceae bacterium]|nr:methylmalonyl Co-A mutase-associated GTPase MeaB [Leptospiraceae bacterium]